MKKIFYLIAAAMLVLAASSCTKDESKDFPPYWQVSTSVRTISGTGGDTDFSKISAVTDQYVNTRFDTESQALAAYNDILSKTKDASFVAIDEAYFKLTLVKYIAKEESETTIRYDADPSYKSPVGHIWDAKGSRDL